MRLVRLDEVAKIQIGKTPKRAINDYWGKGSPWVSISDMKSEIINQTKEQITEKAIKECGCKLIPKGTIIMSFKLSVGKLAFAGKDLFTNEAICGFLLKDQKKIDSKYFYYALKNTRLTGSNMAVMGHTLNTDSLNSLKIPLLDNVSDQILIAEILSKAETLIAQRKESIKLLDELLKSTFLEMFGDPNENEKKWKTEKLNKLTKVGTGGTPSRKRETEFYNGNIYWAKTTEVNGSYIFTTEEKITELALKESNCKLYPINTILLAMYGQGKTRGNVGFLKISVSTNQACAAIPPSNNVNQIFLFELLKNSYNYLRSLARGGNQENLNLNIVGNIDIILPPLELQIKFATVVDKVELLRTQYNQSLIKLENMYGVLSQKAFKGELHIKEINEKVGA